MKCVSKMLLLSGGIIFIAGCATASATRDINPYLTFSEAFGLSAVVPGEDDGEGGGGEQGQALFRRMMTVTFNNNHSEAELNTKFLAWVRPGSIRSAEQQDLLLTDGYRQIGRQITLGTALTLPVGTFIYDGGGFAGATNIFLGPATGTGTAEDPVEPSSRSLQLITPDGLLIFSQPPVACDSVAFFYSENGEPLTSESVSGGVSPFEGATGDGGFKTFAQVDVFECDPFQPGLFIKLGGGTRQPNEFFEGDNVTLDFNRVKDEDGDFAIVTIGG